MISYSFDIFAVTNAYAVDSFPFDMVTVANANAVLAQGLDGRTLIRPTARQTGDKQTARQTDRQTDDRQADTYRSATTVVVIVNIKE